MIRNLKITPSKIDVFSEGITLSLGKIKLVDLGVVKRSVLKEFGIKQEVLFADFNWENVLKVGGKSQIKTAELPKFPAVKRDFALLLDDSVSFNEIYNLAFQAEKKLLKDILSILKYLLFLTIKNPTIKSSEYNPYKRFLRIKSSISLIKLSGV